MGKQSPRRRTHSASSSSSDSLSTDSSHSSDASIDSDDSSDSSDSSVSSASSSSASNPSQSDSSSNSSSNSDSSEDNSEDSDSELDKNKSFREKTRARTRSSSSSSYHTFSDDSDDQHAGDMRALEERICKELQETNYILVRLILKEIGNYEVCKMMLKQTHRLEKGNGIRTADNKRRKTPGGVFFHLAQNRLGQKRFNQLNKQCTKIKKEKVE